MTEYLNLHLPDGQTIARIAQISKYLLVFLSVQMISLIGVNILSIYINIHNWMGMTVALLQIPLGLGILIFHFDLLKLSRIENPWKWTVVVLLCHLLLPTIFVGWIIILVNISRVRKQVLEPQGYRGTFPVLVNPTH